MWVENMYIYANPSLNFESEWEVNEGGEKKEYLSKFVKKRKGNKEFNMASDGENRNPNMAGDGENRNPNMASDGENRNPNMASNGENRNPNMASNGENRNPNMASDGENRNPNIASNGRNSNDVVPPVILPPNEILGGYIFLCDNETMEENLRRQIFCMTDRYQDTVRLIVPGLTLFLFNYETFQLHGIFEATSFGGTNIDPSAWPDNNNPGTSRFPAQVRVRTRRICRPLRVRLNAQLTVTETNALVERFNDVGTP